MFDMLLGAAAVFALAIFKPTWFQAANDGIKGFLRQFGLSL